MPRTTNPRGGVFISYRRDDAPGHAGRLRDALVHRQGFRQVFMDVDSIRPGLDFTAVMEEALSLSGAVLVVIGPSWARITDPEGNPRLADPNDYVRQEVASALGQDRLVLPVLVAGARMPAPAALPDILRPLSTREAFELRDTRWDRDVADLSATLEEVLPRRRVAVTRPRRSLIVGAVVVVAFAVASVVAALRFAGEADPEGSRTAIPEHVQQTLPENARDCRSVVTSLKGLEPDGATCYVGTARSTVTLEVYAVSDEEGALTNLKHGPYDRKGTCFGAPAKGRAEYGDWGNGPYLCDSAREQSISWMDTDAGFFGQLLQPQDGRWETLAAAWKDAMPETPQLELAAALPSGLSGCHPVSANEVDVTEATTAELLCSTTGELTTMRVGLTPTESEQERYVASWVDTRVPELASWCEQEIPNRDAFIANAGEPVRGTRWCLVTDETVGQDRLRYVWTDEEYGVTYVVEDQGGGSTSEQNERMARFWGSLIERYPPWPSQ